MALKTLEISGVMLTIFSRFARKTPGRAVGGVRLSGGRLGVQICTNEQHWWAAPMSSTGEQHRWAAPMSSTGEQHQWAALVSSTDEQHWWAAPMSSTGEQHRWAADPKKNTIRKRSKNYKNTAFCYLRSYNFNIYYISVLKKRIFYPFVVIFFLVYCLVFPLFHTPCQEALA